MLASKKILALFPGALGDFICLLPALEILAGRGRVDLLARMEYGDLVSPGVTVRSLNCWRVSQLYMPEAGRGQELADFFCSYDQVYSWTGFGQSGFSTSLGVASKGRALIFPALPRQSRGHMVDYYLSCVGEKPLHAVCARVSVRPDSMQWCREFWNHNELEGSPVLILAPGSGSREKNWPVSFFAAVADWWCRKLGGKVVVVLGPAEEERGWGQEDIFACAIPIRGTSVANVAALIQHGDLYIGNDSGITHLAAAVGARVIALFGPSDPVRWSPRGKEITVIRRVMECSPCEPIAMKLCPDRACLSGLAQEDVLRAMEYTARCDRRRTGALPS